MPGAHWRSTRGNATRARLLEVGSRYLCERGIAGLSIRSVADECSVTYAALHYHFATHAEFVSAVLKFWSDKVTYRLERAIDGVSGIAGTLVLTREWLDTPELRSILGEVVRPADPRAGHDAIRSQMIEVLRRWIELTQRTLLQARARNELRDRIDVRSVAIDLHRALWSFGWTADLYGDRIARRGVLELVWDRLSAIALDPAATLPERDQFVGAAEHAPAADDDAADDAFVPKDRSGEPAVWFVLMPRVDPQFHAFLRHARMGQMHSLLAPPPVLPEDVAAAEDHARRHPDEVAQWGPPAGFRRTTPASAEVATEPRG